MAADPKAATAYEEGLKGASEKVAEFQEEHSALKKLQHWLHQTPSAVPLIVLIVALAVFGFLSPNFFKATTLSTSFSRSRSSASWAARRPSWC